MCINTYLGYEAAGSFICDSSGRWNRKMGAGIGLSGLAEMLERIGTEAKVWGKNGGWTAPIFMD